MVTKLSKLQRFILLEAAESLPELEEEARKQNAWRKGAVAIGFLNPGFKPIQPGDISYITRNFILINFFKLSLRKKRWGGECIDAEAAGKRYNRANASLYRAIKRLEDRGLIRRMAKKRGGLQLTTQGIAVAKLLADCPLSPPVS
jgi:hypothetical protein